MNVKLSGIVNSMGNSNTTKPGALLRTLREQQNLTVEDVSEKTLISLGKLKLLEEDRYKDVGIDLFVCGYIKKYAHIVGADSDQLIADFKSLHSVPTIDAENADAIVDGSALKNSVADDDKITDKVHTKTDAHNKDIIYTSDTPHFLSKISMLVVVVVLAIIWGVISFFMQDDVSQNVGGSDDASIEASSAEVLPPEVEVVADVTKGTALVVDEAITGDAITSVAESSEEGTIEPSFSELEQEREPALTGDESVITEANISSGVSTVPDVASDSNVQDTVLPSLTLASNATSVVDVEPDNLVFSFSDDCWVSVKNARGESLFAQLQRSGDNLQLSGIAPFDIQLGNARVATLRVNDQPFSIPIKNGRKTSRFTVTP